MIVDTQKIYEAVYNLCFKVNYCLSFEVYESILRSYEREQNQRGKELLGAILQNARASYESKRPLCQDSGQVVVFLRIGQNTVLKGGFVNDVVQKAVEDCYRDNFLRKSVVKNALLDRTNTGTNTPLVLYSEMFDGEGVEIKLLLKGAGAENMSKTMMFKPSSAIADIKKFVLEVVQDAGEKACPPLFVGIGAGGTLDRAALLSKKAFFKNSKTSDSKEKALEIEIKDFLNENFKPNSLSEPILGVSLISEATHIASMPVCVTLNCHSNRHGSARVEAEAVVYADKDYEPLVLEQEKSSESVKRLSTKDVDTIRSLKGGEKVLLSGEIYTARDAAHKKIFELIENQSLLPFDYKNKIIMYAGPAPKAPNEVIGPFGPTTSSRMDEFTPFLHETGLLATIGKGERSSSVNEAIRKNHAVYFTLQGGIACLLAQKVKSSKVIAFEELLSEAVHLIEVEDLEVTVSVSGS